MKLILCPKCNDIVRLIDSKRSCRCGNVHGWYKDRKNAVVSKHAIPIGIDNKSLARAARNRPINMFEEDNPGHLLLLYYHICVHL